VIVIRLVKNEQMKRRHESLGVYKTRDKPRMRTGAHTRDGVKQGGDLDWGATEFEKNSTHGEEENEGVNSINDPGIEEIALLIHDAMEHSQGMVSLNGGGDNNGQVQTKPRFERRKKAKKILRGEKKQCFSAPNQEKKKVKKAGEV